MLYKGTVQILIEIPAWVEADSSEEAQAKLESMNRDDLIKSLHIENVLDLHPSEMEDSDQILWQELQ